MLCFFVTQLLHYSPKKLQECNLAKLTANNLLKQLERKLVVPPWTIAHFFEPMISWTDVRMTVKGTTTNDFLEKNEYYCDDNADFA